MKIFLINFRYFGINIYVEAQSRDLVANELKKKGWEFDSYYLIEIHYVNYGEIPTIKNLLDGIK